MTVSITLSEKATEALRAKAAAAGVDEATFAARELERSLAEPRNLMDISGPAFVEFQKSGMTDEQLGDLLEDAKHTMRAERRARRGA